MSVARECDYASSSSRAVALSWWSAMDMASAAARSGSSSSSPTLSASAWRSNASSSSIIGSTGAGEVSALPAPSVVVTGASDARAATSPVDSRAAGFSAAARCCASCLARSSSREILNAIINAGSSPMSPMSPPKPCMAAWDCAAAAAAAKPLPPAGPSWLKIAVPHNTSDKFAPGSTVTKFELLFLFTAPMNAANFSSFASISPKETTSTATLHLRNFFPTATSSFSSTLIGLPINNTIRMRWCLFCLCFNAKCATCTPTQMLISPSILIPCTELSTAPKSCVGVTSTRGTLPAKLNTPTAFSGLLCVLAPASKFTASASA
mmetsp:Transcript_3080/g.10220  ORF Transcript_3080/g.10220 Transcript_3080/m.10220 type:complete len:322 (-) Transcript_3080:109-1074(-)